MRNILAFILFVFLAIDSNAQITFQKIYAQPDSGSNFQAYDSKATPDGGYILGGLASEGTTNVLHPFIMKVNCKGETQWYQLFGTTQSISNVHHKVIVTQDSNYILMSNLGVNTNYNGFVVKVDPTGNVLWQKLLNLSVGNDVVSDIIETSTGHLLLTGSIKSTPDVGVIKLNADGTLVWNKTFGNSLDYDEGSAIIEMNDGSYLITGRYVSMGTFNAFLLKTDTSGVKQWFKCYGDTLQHMWGFDIKELGNGDIVMAGYNTLLKPSYQSYGDNFVMRLNNVGDTLWSKIFYGTPDQFENVSSIEIDPQGNFILGVATASYPTAGFVPNKHAIMKFSPIGNLLLAKTYNGGSSHYARLAKAMDGGYILSGFSTLYTGPVGFNTLLMKLDENLNSGCFETDVTALTVVSSKNFRITQPIPLLGASGSSIDNITTYTTQVEDSVLCQSFPLLVAGYTYNDKCLSSTTHFVADTSGISYWHWDFGDIGTSDTSLSSTTSYTYPTTGNYTVTLIVGNGCEYDTTTQVVTIFNPSQAIMLGPDTVKCKDSLLTIGINTGATSYLWNTGDTTATIQVSQAGTYILTADFASCGLMSDTIIVYEKECFPNSIPSDPTIVKCEVLLPNAFSPNGDGLNDVLKPILKTGMYGFEFVQFELFNRWGKKIFSSNNPNDAWDGKFNGEEQPTDSYYFYIRYRCNGDMKIVKGDVVLIR